MFSSKRIDAKRRTVMGWAARAVVEEMEARCLLSSPGDIVAALNSGFAQFRRNGSAIASSFTGDLPDVPLLENGWLAPLELGRKLSDAFNVKIPSVGSTGEIVSRLNGAGFAASVDGNGDIAFSKTLIWGTGSGVSLGIGGKGWNYLDSYASGSLDGSIRARARVTFTLVGGIDGTAGTPSLYLSDASQLTVSGLSGSGSVSARMGVGSLTAVSVSGRGTAKLAASLDFSDPGDHRIRAGEIADRTFRATAINGVLDGTVTAALQFNASIAPAVALGWSGTFSAGVNHNSVSKHENLVTPNYQDVLKTVAKGLFGTTQHFPILGKIEEYLERPLPYLDKSIWDMANIGPKVGPVMLAVSPPNWDAMSFDQISAKLQNYGLTVGITAANGSQLMDGLIHGKTIDLLGYQTKGSIGLASFDQNWPILEFSLWGLVNGEVGVELSASLSFTYNINLGISTKGFYLGNGTAVGIEGDLSGGIYGKGTVLWKLAEASISGDLTARVSAQARLNNASWDNRLYLTDLSGNVFDALKGKLATDVVATLEGSAKAKVKVFGFTVWKKTLWQDTLSTLYEYHSSPVSGGSVLASEALAGADAVGAPIAPVIARGFNPRPTDVTYEASKLLVSGTSGDFAVGPQYMSAFADRGQWVNGQQLAGAANEGVGAKTDLRVYVPADGTYNLILYPTKSPDYGTVQLYLDGQALGAPIDLYNEGGVANGDPIDLGTLALRKGASTLSVQVVGANPNGGTGWGINAMDLGEYEDTWDGPTDGSAPATPGLSVASRGSNSVTLAIGDNSNNEAGFIVESSSDGVNWKLAADLPANSTSVTIDGLRAQTMYRFRVTAVDAAGRSSTSRVVTTETRGKRPTGLLVTDRGPDQASFQFNDNTSNEDHFEAWESTDGGNSFHLGENIPANHPYFTRTGWSPNRQYIVKVRAVMADGATDFSDPVTVNTTAAPIPVAPSGLVVSGTGYTSADFQFRDNSSNEDHFEAWESTDGGANFHLGENIPADHPYFTRTGWNAGGTYVVKVRAVNSWGASAFSDPVTVTTTAKPGRPTGLVVSSVGFSDASFRFNDNSSDEDHFEAWESTDGGASYHLGENIPADHPYFSRTGWSANTTYLVKVRAVNAYGASDFSDPVTVTTPRNIQPPTNLHVVSVGSSFVKIAWNEVSGEDHYEAWISRDGVNFSLKENVPADHAYADQLDGLAANTKYWVKVFAVDSAGHRSGASNVISFTTTR